MSDVKQETHDKIAREIEISKKSDDLREKKLVLEERRVNSQIKRLQESDRALELVENADLERMSDEQVEEIRRINREYIMSARNRMVFINKDFDGVVPFFPKNIILVGGTTGTGKSTTVANIAHSVISQKDPNTGKRRRVLVITNEERTEDVYNRITCLIKGWQYTNHDEFTDEQLETFDSYIDKFGKSGLITVVDDNHNGATGVTTTIEGIEMLLNNLIKSQTYYDAIVFDYYQNIKFSTNDATMNEYAVQARFSNMIDRFKNIYPGAIVVLAQVDPLRDEDDKTPFEYRIKGRKVIAVPSTFIVEMKAERQNLRTSWTIHKSRFTKSVGETFFTGYDKGKFVPYTDEFAREVAAIQEARNLEKLQRLTDDKKDTQK